MTSKMETFIVDSFADSPFRGNPTVICMMRDCLDEEMMQKIAAEMNQSQTVFVSIHTTGDNFSSATQFNLRWFSPTCEVNLCGHGTLATAAVLFRVYKNPNKVLIHNTLSGHLKTIYDEREEQISLFLPLKECLPQNKSDFEELVKVSVGDLPLADCQYSPDGLKLLIRLADTVTRRQLEELRPDTQAMLNVDQTNIKGIIVTVKSLDEKYDFYSRYFAPWWGNPEDHVTGAAHTVLVPFWSRQLKKKIMNARQCSLRGGDLTVTMVEEGEGHEGKGTVVLKGKAFILVHGKIII